MLSAQLASPRSRMKPVALPRNVSMTGILFRIVSGWCASRNSIRSGTSAWSR